MAEAVTRRAQDVGRGVRSADLIGRRRGTRDHQRLPLPDCISPRLVLVLVPSNLQTWATFAVKVWKDCPGVGFRVILKELMAATLLVCICHRLVCQGAQGCCTVKDSLSSSPEAPYHRETDLPTLPPAT
eukprot:1852404-Rhodomonas_salina.1